MPKATATSAARSTRPLSEVARHVVVPTGIVDTVWFEVERQCAEWGDRFDTWQDGLGQLALGVRADGIYAASIGGVTLSIPRQVAKTFIVGRIVFALCALFPDLKVIWTAHRSRTATNTFRTLQAYAQRKKVAPYIKHIRTANGEQEIAFTNGSVIMFGAREQGFGRGFDEIDIEVFDESQILTAKALEDMVAATNQARNPHGALLFFMGTPPRPNDPGEEFTNRRRKALAVKPADVVYAEHGDGMYVECSADPNVGKDGGPSLDDVAQVAIANPSYPHRTPQVSVARLRENLTADDSWRREGLGVWDEFDKVDSAVNLAAWVTLQDKDAPAPARGTVVIDVDPNRAHSSIGLASEFGDKTLLLGLFDSGTSWVVTELVNLRNKGVIEAEVALHPSSQAGALIPAIEAAGFEVYRLTTQEMGAACAGFIEGVKQSRFVHVGQDELDAAVAVARTRFVGEAELWDRKDRRTDISPLVAISAAAYRLASLNLQPSVYESRGVVVL